MKSITHGREALELRVTGLIQGVGFRPFVHRIAQRHELAGWVRNTAGSVEIEIEGSPRELRRFLVELNVEAPPLAQIATVESRWRPVSGRSGFAILASAIDHSSRQPVSPDVATCDQCLAELFDPVNRRHHYPFITCTDCGPRFTVIEAMPYDRERTSMRHFPQCPACLAEYHTPGNRRHHSETNSCPACGPKLWCTGSSGEAITHGTAESIEAAAGLLRLGGILAVRGLGGFHLACDATDHRAVAWLRKRKGREAKPLAVMVGSLEAAARLVRLTLQDRALLQSPARPIVVAERLPGTRLAPAVAPGLVQVGIMLAYTPLHHLLLAAVGRPLVMTSGNRSEEPIAISNAEALQRLGSIADAFLFHDREIVARYDDSVVRSTAVGPVFLRRARGYAPLPLRLPVATPIPILAVGPHLKNTFTLASENQAWVSQHIGDLENFETLEHFRTALDRFRSLFRIDPQAVVRDLHPGYLSSAEADRLGIGPVLQVQHHHAHVAAVLAEHGRTRPAIGVAFDGTGYGTDGTVWGGEFLLADLEQFQRVGFLRPAPLPGGDLAVRTPWRSALGYLSLDPSRASRFERAFAAVPAVERRVAEQQVQRHLNAPLASSVGRLFDAAAAVLGVRSTSQFEGQAAMELEAIAGSRVAQPLEFPIVDTAKGWVLDPVPLLAALGAGVKAGQAVEHLAAAFHTSLAHATALAARRACEHAGVGTVVLAGGVFQNARLLASVASRLKAMGVEVLTATLLSPNDGAVSYGQAAIAAARLARGLGN